MKEAKFKSGFVDFNGVLTTERIHIGEDPHGEALIADEIFSLLNKKNIKGISPIQVHEERYEDYSENEIKKLHEDDGVECKIIKGEKTSISRR